MYGNDFEMQAVDIAYGNRPIAPVLQQYGVNLVLVKTHAVVADEVSALPGWRRVYSDRLATVFTRDT
jgi:ABC-type uncharacterized transport system YnjBCD substrate-binding protein